MIDTAVSGAGAAAERQPRARRRARRPRRMAAPRQGHRHRSGADRADAALEPGDVHRPLHPRPRGLRAAPGGAGARLRPGSVLVQREGRALRGVQGGRRHPDRDALPPRRLRDLRGLQRTALLARDPRGARTAGRASPTSSISRWRRRSTSSRRSSRSDQARDFARRRARLRAPRSVGDDALRGRGAADQARPRARSPRHRDGPSTSSTSRRRACISRTLGGSWPSSSGSPIRATPWS